MANHMADAAQIGVTGLATMGRNLARNLASHGFSVAVHNRTDSKTDALMAEHGSEGTFIPSHELADFVVSLQRPRRIIAMVKAGEGTDAALDGLVPLLDEGDIVVDAGNAHFADTRRRENALKAKGIRFVGAGVSGGEEGALYGPSIMPGGAPEAYAELAPMLESIAAHVDGDPCCVHIGPDGAGHFVKMVHNGIEYADMQLIGEAYQILRAGLGASPAELSDIFAAWNTTDIASFLIEIAAQVLAREDPDTGAPFVDIVADEAEQKGTGRWTVQTALDLGVGVGGISEAVFARAVSGAVSQRAAIRTVYPTDVHPVPVTDRDEFVEKVRRALLSSKIVAYAQGLDIIRAGSEEYHWRINLSDMAKIWRGGCIIRASLLERIRAAYDENPQLENMLVADHFRSTIADNESAWRDIVSHAVQAGIPVPAFSSTLAYLDSLRAPRLPAALIQGLRDLFGAHTYRRVDTDGVFHVEWAGSGKQVRTDA